MTLSPSQRQGSVRPVPASSSVQPRKRETVSSARPLPELVRMEVVAKALGVTERHVRRLVDERRIPFVKVGYFIRFEPEEVARWVKEHRVDGRGGLRSRRPAR